MSWLDALKVNEVIAVIGVLTGFLGAAAAIITARWNRRATLSDETVATLRQQMDMIKQQATQTERNVKEQLSYYKDLSPADIQKQLSAVRLLLTERIKDLEEKLETSNRLLRDKTAEKQGRYCHCVGLRKGFPWDQRRRIACTRFSWTHNQLWKDYRFRRGRFERKILLYRIFAAISAK
jgi:hypothetical protein